MEKDKIKKLYHYTSIENLLLILKTKSICFSSLENVDDMEEKETGEVVAKGKIINDTTKFPFTLEIEHSAQVSAKNKAYLKVTANWAGDNDELDSKWGYTVGKYFMDNPKVTSAMSVTLSIDSYQANEEIKGGTE